MFKRANKITALLVAAASIMSVVPAMAATKLATKDGTIEKAISYDGGKYIYEGYRTDDDDKAVYYNGGDKDKKLDDVDTLGAKFDDKYAGAFDGDSREDEYIVDLSNGKISDDDTITDLKQTALTKLNTKLAKTDRYDGLPQISDDDFKQIPEDARSQFGDIWYSYTSTTATSVEAIATALHNHPEVTNVTTAAGAYYGYTNASGSYIDCSKTANIYVYSKEKKKMIKFDDFGDTDSDTGITIGLPTLVKTLGQDKDYLYNVIKVPVVGASKNKIASSDSNYQAVDYLYYVQKISKAQGSDKEKKAYLPKSVESYEISQYLGDDDVATAFTELNTNNDEYRIVDGAIYAARYDGDEKVKVFKLALKTSVKLYDYNQTASKTSNDKIDAHVVQKTDDADQKIENTNDDRSWTFDVNGNLWAIKGGTIYKSVKAGDFTEVYTCDRSFDSIDVYNDDNLIAWEDGGDAYTTVAEGKKQAQDDANAIVQPTPAKVGWDKLADGSWNFYDATGAKVVNNWANVGGAWYFLKADGVMATGWQQVGGVWYYLNASGAMATGWINDGGNWYYLNASGAMLANTTTPDGYYVGSNGAWVK
ncbi:N-acetylmuramoyl-L-alanine amidase family protein [Clostridium beijerinckii]|uniref:Autolysin n=1 Tax=Clostridium beijerinckii TaxID=1520 RepID=A0A1S8SBJ5_CLOBE|nr:N-acetylmuramoyl-L-alanine amidase family protein [Clostridium beijerinckii]NRY60544.1 glucan-binding YG repeat protein [Clostridium beijerinckii]OOM62585.1 autolysin [Clostridium beijerinckii]